jgi:hypothetical protein
VCALAASIHNAYSRSRLAPSMSSSVASLCLLGLAAAGWFSRTAIVKSCAPSQRARLSTCLHAAPLRRTPAATSPIACAPAPPVLRCCASSGGHRACGCSWCPPRAAAAVTVTVGQAQRTGMQHAADAHARAGTALAAPSSLALVPARHGRSAHAHCAACTRCRSLHATPALRQHQAGAGVHPPRSPPRRVGAQRKCEHPVPARVVPSGADCSARVRVCGRLPGCGRPGAAHSAGHSGPAHARRRG